MEKKPRITQITVPSEPERVPTGAVQFNDDWPGLFIRGDDALTLMLELKDVLKTLAEQNDQQCQTYFIRNIVSIIEQDVIVR
jgi:hypothetical protein